MSNTDKDSVIKEMPEEHAPDTEQSNIEDKQQNSGDNLSGAEVKAKKDTKPDEPVEGDEPDEGDEPVYIIGEPVDSIPNAQATSKTHRFLVCATVVIGLLAIAFMVFNRIFFGLSNSIPSEVRVDTELNSVISAELSDNKLTYSPLSMAINFGDWVGQVNLDLSEDTTISHCDVMDNELVLIYLRENGTIQYEILIGSTAYDLGSFTSDEVSQVIESKDTVLTDTTETDAMDTYEAIASIYGIGYIYVRESVITIDTEGFEETDASAENNALSIANAIKDTMVFSKNTSADKIIHLGSLGELNIDDLSVLDESSGLLYRATENMLDIYDPSSQSVIVFITQMYNMMIGNVPSNLIPTDYPNLYVDAGFQNNANFGYGGLAVMTSEGMYYFKISEHVQDLEGFAEELVNWLGLSENDEKIEVPYDITLTMDDMLPPNEEEPSQTE